MKKIFLLIAIIIAFGGGYYFYLKSDKKILEDFTNQITNESVTTNSIIDKYVKHTEKGKQLSLFVLNLIREQYKKKGDQIIINSADEIGKNLQNEIKLKNGERLYYVKFNEEMTQPFIINRESKIIVLLVLTKGGGTLSDSRSDE